MSKYEENKAAKVGSTITCPTCGKEFVKKQYSQAFCCLQCKDKYWNTIGDRHKGPNEAFKKQQPELPTLRQAIEECMYDQLVRKVPTCPDGAGIELRIKISRSTARKLKKDYEQNGIQATAVGKVFTNTDPMNLYVERDQWAALLGQFDNGQRVRIILVKEEDAE